MEMTKEIMLMLNDTETVRVLNTISEDGSPHSIAVNTAMTKDTNQISIANIKMNTTAKNLRKNKSISILTVKGYDSYLIKASVKGYVEEGLLYDAINEEAKKKGLTCQGLWLFEPYETINQSMFTE